MAGDAKKGYTVNYDDINQQYLGDCYFLAGCATTASKPRGILDVYNQTPAFNGAGLLAVQVYIRGRPWTLVMDTNLPFYGGNLIFDNFSSKKAAWGPYLEKAWAKTNGNYEIIEGGLQKETFAFMTGCPTQLIQLTNANAATNVATAWNTLTAATKAGYLIGVDCI